MIVCVCVYVCDVHVCVRVFGLSKGGGRVEYECVCVCVCACVRACVSPMQG